MTSQAHQCAGALTAGGSHSAKDKWAQAAGAAGCEYGGQNRPQAATCKAACGWKTLQPRLKLHHGHHLCLLRVSPTCESQANIRVSKKWCGLADSACNSTATVGASVLPQNRWRTSKGIRQGCYAGGVSHDSHAVCAWQVAAGRNNCLLRALQCGGPQEVICARTSSLSHPLRRG